MMTASIPTTTEGSHSSDRANLFPQYLMKLLNDEVAPEALWWLPDGKAFALSPEKIGDQVLDKHFQKTKYSSFIRRLHNEGYRRQTRKYKKTALNLPEGTVVLSHDAFQRGAPQLLEQFYNKNLSKNRSSTALSKQPTALQQAKAENKAAQTSLFSNKLSPLDTSTGADPLSNAALLQGWSAQRINQRINSSLLGTGALPTFQRVNSACKPAPIPESLFSISGSAGFGAANASSSLAKSLHLAALRQVAVAQHPGPVAVSRSSSIESAPASSPTLTAAPAPIPSATTLFNSQLRLQQLRQLQEQKERLSALHSALRFRAGAGFSTTPQWP